MEIQRWQPLSELMSLRQAMDRLFEDSFVRPSQLPSAADQAIMPALDIYQTENDVVVKVTLPGVRPEDVNVDIVGDTLTIRGESRGEEEIKKENYLYKERRYGVFSRSVILPIGIQSDKADATIEDGVLTLTIPKVEEVKPKVIEVKAKEKTEAKTKGKKK